MAMHRAWFRPAAPDGVRATPCHRPSPSHTLLSSGACQRGDRITQAHCTRRPLDWPELTEQTGQLRGMFMNEKLDAYWMPFTANRQFKREPRMLARASGMHFWTPEGRQILDG